ncbi:unnamed protein product [Cercospora beticola]|nr:unnamed protein product [Cercospora beticola]
MSFREFWTCICSSSRASTSFRPSQLTSHTALPDVLGSALLLQQRMLHACVRWFPLFRNLGIGHARPVWHPGPLPLCRRFATLEARKVPSVNILGTEKQRSGPDEESQSAQIYRFYSPAEDQQILRRRKEGAFYRAIGAELGRSEYAVNARYRRLVLLHGHEGEVKRKKFPRPSKFTAEEDAHIIRRRAEAATFTTIASELGSYSRHKVNTRWRDLFASGKARGTSPLKERPRPLTDGQYKQILALKQKGLKWREIASHVQRKVGGLQNMVYYRSLAENAPSTILKRWTDTETATLIRLREKDSKSWSEIANAMNRSYKSVESQYDHVRPRVSGSVRCSRNPWTKAEDEKLLELVKQHGRKWSLFGGLIGSRTVDAMRRRYDYRLEHSTVSTPIHDTGAGNEIESERFACSH